jgi:hypothetical protein
MFNFLNYTKKFRSTKWTFLQDSSTGAQQGISVSISDDGNVSVVGNQYDTVGGISGTATVYRRTNNVWAKEQKLIPSDGYSTSQLVSVAISGDGNYIALGYPYYSASALKDAMVFIFKYTSGTWVEQHKIANLVDDDGRGQHRAGYSVSLNYTGDTIALGAPYWDTGTGGGNDDRGAVIIYTRSGTSWTQQRVIDPSITSGSSSYSGTSVSLDSSGNTLAIGTPSETVSGISNAGAVYIWTRSGTTWTREARLTLASYYSNERFGYSVALSSSGNNLISGSPGYVNASTGEGRATTFNRSGTTWTLNNTVYSNIPYPAGYGQSVSVNSNGTIFAVGAPHVLGINPSYGNVYIYNANNLINIISILPDTGTEHRLGTACCLSKNNKTLIASGPTTSSTGGSYIFDRR